MGIGQFSHKIIFQSYTSMPDGFGGKADTPVDVLTTWAKKEPLRSSRELAENQVALRNVNRYTVRVRDGFQPTEKMRIVDGGVQYTINGSIEQDAARRFWIITAIAQT